MNPSSTYVQNIHKTKQTTTKTERAYGTTLQKRKKGQSYRVESTTEPEVSIQSARVDIDVYVKGKEKTECMISG